jgi:GNAT superfamily N-acetyltransferase
VAVEDRRILGFATIAAGHLEIEGLPAAPRARLPRYPLPVLRLARLAVDESAHSHGLGTELLRFVLKRLPTEELRGNEALTEIALVLSSARAFPVTNRVLGYATSCKAAAIDAGY